MPAGLGLPAVAPTEPDQVTASTQVWTTRLPPEIVDAAEKIIRSGHTGWDAPVAGEVLEHGDCHTENVVRDEHGRFRWVDWQEARTGDGFSDLAFLWQRAEFAGAHPPRAAMTQAYLAARGSAFDDQVRHALHMAELRLLFLAWPPFLSYGPPSRQRHLADELRELIIALG